MPENWSDIVKQFRVRHGVSQLHVGDLLGVSQRTVSRWERGEDRPGLPHQKKLRDLGLIVGSQLLQSLALSIQHCPAPRALSRLPGIVLEAFSQPSEAKRPSITALVGHRLAPLAEGVLAEMLDDAHLQSGIRTHDIACVVATTASVLRTSESPAIGLFETTITYFTHDGTLYADAISIPAAADAITGYRAIPTRFPG